MRIFATRRQCEQIVIALMAVFGSQDEDALKTIATINKALLMQCESDKSRYVPTTIAPKMITNKEDKS